jgi:hypothetical protein
MAILLENSLARTSSKLYDSYYSYRDFAGIIPINNIIKGNLTTLTDTSDVYQFNVQKPTLIRVKFNVEQITNEFDYYDLITPVGIFYGDPTNINYKQLSIPGIFFQVESTALFIVAGSSRGVFSENYTLEITELTSGYLENHISPHKWYMGGDEKTVNIGANNTIDAWNQSTVMLKTPPMSKGETGTFVVYLDRLTHYNAFAKSGTLYLTMQNEAKREIFKYNDLDEKKFISIPNLYSGIYYLKVDTYLSPTQYSLDVNFYKTFNDKESIVYNTDGIDRFPDWNNKLDKVIYSESISNYTIGKANSVGHFNVSHKVKTDDFDVLQTVERVVFLDKTIAFDFSSNEAGYKSAMLIAASFGKEYVPQFFAKALSFFDSGSTTKEISKVIVDNKFIEQLIGDNSDSAWIKHVYKNVVGVYPDKVSETNLVTLLQNKTNTRSEILEFAAGFTFLETRIDLVGLQTNGLVFDTLS